MIKKIAFAYLLAGSVFLVNGQYLKISENSRYLVTDDGKPFFWLADTGWELFHRLNAGEADIYLKTRASQGFTVIQTVILGECDGVTEPTPDGYLPLIDKDITKPNPYFFKIVDEIIAKAASYGLYVAILPTWGSHAQDKWHPFFQNLNLFNSQTAYQYGKFLGERYKNSWNVLWILGGDRLPSETEKIWNDMARGLLEGSDGKQLLSYHPCGIHSTIEFSRDFNWLNFHSFQSGHAKENYPVWEMVSEALLTTPAMPVLNMEPCYENIGKGFNSSNGLFTDYDTRKAAYWSVFSGAFGHTYGHNSVWQMWSSKHSPILDADIPWYEAIHATGALQMRYLKNLMLSRPFISRIPDQSIILSETGHESDYVCATRDGTSGKNDATYIMAYLPVIKEIKINTSVIPGKKINAWWYNPQTGIAYFHGTAINTGEFRPSWENRIHKPMGGPDWVLVIDDASKNYGF